MIQQFPKLFARGNTGSVLVWWMEQRNNCYRTQSGQIDGKLVASEWTVAEPKNVGRSNATSPVEQATAEIEARYKKQLKSGGYFRDIKDIDQSRFFEPMLAKDFKDYAADIDWKAGVGIQIKYNGGRIIARKEGLFSRKGEKFVCVPHIERTLAPYFKRFPDAVLDGEGFNYGLRQNLKEIMKLLRKTVHITPADLKRSEELIRYYVYDGFGFGDVGQEHGYKERKRGIDNLLGEEYTAAHAIHYVPTWYVHSEDELNELYTQFLGDDQEGAIIRILGQGYENKRTKNLLKFKPVDDAEFQIIDVQEGDGNWSGVAKVISCKTLNGEKFKDGTDTFNATFKGTREQALECLRMKGRLIGKTVTIYYNGLTGFGKPNYARFDWNNYDKGH